MEAPFLTPANVQPLAFDVGLRLEEIDQSKLNSERLTKIQRELARHDYAGCLLADPINIRYATGSRNQFGWTIHAPGRWAFISTAGPVVLFEFLSSKHLNDGLKTIDEIRGSTPWFFQVAGGRADEKADSWAKDIAAVVREYGGSNNRLAVDRCEPRGADRLRSHGIKLFDAQEALERARSIKTVEEIQALRLATDVCDVGCERMKAALQPGITENQLWAVFHDVNIAHNGEWIESRFLCSGERTNPWYQECSDRVIQAGDLVAFDSDMIGPLGYMSDISRTWICPGKTPTAEQRELYEISQEQLLTNIELLKPGLSAREFAEAAWPLPERFVPNRYMAMVHGVGMVGEYPQIPFGCDFAELGYEATFEENMVVSVESYIGERGRKEGVKLEQQVLITSRGAEILSKTPLVDALEL
ncbi:Xaa-Pro peptidase family protein [Mesorhizobium sp. WSM3860]|uniref:M24 family metallopeptidase n=1 Tax=Mesorhizobium sp. WSM3860 TaxID=2029403 RepID=UPI000BB02B36|nr:Xaa-Pro peptidase family protein [Mesorhizobium sp. WSM3860]PBC03690.1 peptidase M24 [Mesorhizobium sp. WSM3860]